MAQKRCDKPLRDELQYLRGELSRLQKRVGRKPGGLPLLKEAIQRKNAGDCRGARFFADALREWMSRAVFDEDAARVQRVFGVSGEAAIAALRGRRED